MGPVFEPPVAAATVASAGPEAAAAPSAAVRRSRAVVVAGVLALAGLGLAWELALAPTGRGTLALKVLPLLLALPGLWRYRLYTVRWLSLLVWAYVTEGLVRATSDPGLAARLAGVEAVLGVALFAACVWHVRARFGAARGDLARGERPGDADPTAIASRDRSSVASDEAQR